MCSTIRFLIFLQTKQETLYVGPWILKNVFAGFPLIVNLRVTVSLHFFNVGKEPVCGGVGKREREENTQSFQVVKT